ncbi:MAG: hypothetical protein JSW18_00095, partial [Candidatus Omnitrophota bacterium]
METQKVNLNHWTNWKWLLLLLIGIIYLFPMFVQFSFTRDDRIESVSLSMPRILTGDVPHYLVMVYSLVEDKDLCLKNNYEDARYKGANSVGFSFRYRPFPYHHVRYINKKTGDWYATSELFNQEGRLPGKENIDLTEFEEYPVHPPGLPLLAALFLWPFGYSAF